MGGVDTNRGIAYQNAQAVMTALDVIHNERAASLRVEGSDDILDIEVLAPDGEILSGTQVKTRRPNRPWGKAPILAALRRWLQLDLSDASFEFVTDGPLGPSATELQDALVQASKGKLQPLGDFLNVPQDDPTLLRWTSLSVRRDVTGSEAVLSVAEQQVRSLLPGERTKADLQANARSRVNDMLRELSHRAGETDPKRRVLTKTEIHELLGGVRGIPEQDRWSTGVRDEYIARIAGSPVQLIEMRLRNTEGDDSAPDLQLTHLFDGRSPTLLSARTGAGKTSAATLASRLAAVGDKPVLLVHAELYVATRLSALVADSLSRTIGRDLPISAGQQAMNDSDCVLIIDGASEIPATMRRALKEELKVVQANNGARLVLVGRDQAVLLSLIHKSPTPRTLTLLPLTRDEHRSLAAQEMSEEWVHLSESGREQAISKMVLEIERQLGDAAGNPMLFSMALRTHGADGEALTGARLYSASVQQMFQRAHAIDAELTSTALGMVFSRLLNDGRRFVYPHEYRRLLTASLQALSGQYFEVDADQVAESIQSSGLLTPLGADQVLVPVHDSYADFLAGLAYARHMASMPEVLSSNDERRIEFAMQLGAADELAVPVCRDIPFSIVRVSKSDDRPLHRSESPEEIHAALAELLPPGDNRSPALWRERGTIIVALTRHLPAGWIDESVVRKSGAPEVLIVANPGESVLAMVTRLWRAFINSGLRVPRTLPAPHQDSPEVAAELIEDHVRRRGQAVVDLATAALSPTAAAQVLAAIGDLGIEAVISREIKYWNGYQLVYRSADGIDVKVVDGELDGASRNGSEEGYVATATGGFLSRPPEEDAAQTISTQIEQFTERAWLQ